MSVLFYFHIKFTINTIFQSVGSNFFLVNITILKQRKRKFIILNTPEIQLRNIIRLTVYQV